MPLRTQPATVSVPRFIASILLSVFSATAVAVGVPTQGTWVEELEGRDLDGDPSTAEAYYDEVLGITWLADVLYPLTTGVDDNGRLDINEVDAYVAGLNVHGITGWRLPAINPVNGSEYQLDGSTDGSTDRGCAGPNGWTDSTGYPTSELGRMFYVLLGNDPTFCDGSPDQVPGGGMTNTGPFINLAPRPGFQMQFWSSARVRPYWPFRQDFAINLSFLTGNQNFNVGGQLNVWPVIDGDVGIPTTQPLPSLANPQPLIELGALSIPGSEEPRPNGFLQQQFATTMVEPVIFADAPWTTVRKVAGVHRLRRVSAAGYEAKFQPWDRALPDERPSRSLMAIERGRYVLPDGAIWEVGTLTHRHTFDWKAHAFEGSFPEAPAVFLSIQTTNGASPVIARARNVTANGFEVRLFEAEIEMDWHAEEVIGYLAIHAPDGRSVIETVGTSASQSTLWTGTYRTDTAEANHNPTSVPRDGSILGLSVSVLEEQTFDEERFHTRERIDLLRIGERLVFLQDVSTRGLDTSNVVYSQP
ncbi:MAG: hypothetical protein AAGI15_08020 [Pseudomonadota bacterium]